MMSPLKSAMTLALVLPLCACVSVRGTVKSSDCVSEWRLFYSHDADGAPAFGERRGLIEALRRGSPIRVGWSEASEEGWSVEEFADTTFVNIMGGTHVVAQIEPALIQSHYLDADQSGLRTPARDWNAIIATTGRFDALMIDRESGKTIRHLRQRTRVAWYAFAPMPRCDVRPSRDLLLETNRQESDQKFD